MTRTFLVVLDVEAEESADLPTIDELATSLSCVLSDGPGDDYRWANSTLYGTLADLTQDVAEGAFPHLVTDGGAAGGTEAGAFVAHWAFTNADNDVVLFSKTYGHEPTDDAVREDGYLWYHEEEGGTVDEAAFEAWHDGLCQTGLVSIVPLG